MEKQMETGGGFSGSPLFRRTLDGEFEVTSLALYLKVSPIETLSSLIYTPRRLIHAAVTEYMTIYVVETGEGRTILETRASCVDRRKTPIVRLRLGILCYELFELAGTQRQLRHLNPQSIGHCIRQR